MDMNPYELSGRAAKVNALVDALTTQDDPLAVAAAMAPLDWEKLARKVGIRVPSEQTIHQVTMRLRERKANQALSVDEIFAKLAR